MESFNIRVPHLGEDVTLTVNHTQHQYRIIYNGGILGSIKQEGDEWRWLAQEEIVVGELPPLAEKKGLANDELPFNLHEINQIAGAITNHLSGH